MDDDESLLEGLAVSLRKDFDLVTAVGAEDAFGAIQMFGPPTVVVSDMRMPGMDGATFLNRLRDAYPQTVRILLTGHADMADAARAVNEARVFRLLEKPCSAEVMQQALRAAAAHAERISTRPVGTRDDVSEHPAPGVPPRPAPLATQSVAAGHQLSTFVPVLRAVLARLSDCAAAGFPPDAQTLHALTRVSDQVEAQAGRLLGTDRLSGQGRERVNLCQVLRETLALFRSSWAPRDLPIHCETPARPVFADLARVHVEQVLINLLRNAAQAVRSLPDREPLIRLRVTDAGGAGPRIDVSDNGCGISAEALSLAVVSEIVESHGGLVAVTSAEGMGTTVSITLRWA